MDNECLNGEVVDPYTLSRWSANIMTIYQNEATYARTACPGREVQKVMALLKYSWEPHTTEGVHDSR